MLVPSRVKHRKQHRGRMSGRATRGNTITFGDYGLMALECGWVTNRQIEAARIAMTRFIKRGGQVWIKIFPDSLLRQSQQKPEWVVVKGHPNTGLLLLNLVVLCLNLTACRKNKRERLCVSQC